MGSTIRGSEPRNGGAVTDCGSRPLRRRIWFGPGSILAILVGGAVLVMRGTGSDADQFGTSGRLVYRADSQGRMRRIDAPAAGVIPPPALPLWKPEVGLLLEYGSFLGLTAVQRREIGSVDARWRSEKGMLEADLRSASGGAANMLERASADRGATLQVLRRGLKDYSALSREYDSRRAVHWSLGVSHLNAKQRELSGGLRPSTEARSGR